MISCNVIAMLVFGLCQRIKLLSVPTCWIGGGELVSGPYCLPHSFRQHSTSIMALKKYLYMSLIFRYNFIKSAVSVLSALNRCQNWEIDKTSWTCLHIENSEIIWLLIIKLPIWLWLIPFVICLHFIDSSIQVRHQAKINPGPSPPSWFVGKSDCTKEDYFLKVRNYLIVDGGKLSLQSKKLLLGTLVKVEWNFCMVS